jgi:cytochrome c553
MKIARPALLSAVMVALALSLASAADRERGEALFNDPGLGGGITGMSCGTCHESGAGLQEAADVEGIEEEVNQCIVKALEGEPVRGRDMEDLMEYINSLKGQSTEKALSFPGC